MAPWLRPWLVGSKSVTLAPSTSPFSKPSGPHGETEPLPQNAEITPDVAARTAAVSPKAFSSN